MRPTKTALNSGWLLCPTARVTMAHISAALAQARRRTDRFGPFARRVVDDRATTINREKMY